MDALSPQSVYGGLPPGGMAGLGSPSPFLQGVTPEFLELLQYLLTMTGAGQNGAGYFPQGPGSFGGGFGGGGFGGGGGAPTMGGGLGNFLGAGNPGSSFGGFGAPSGGGYSGNSYGGSYAPPSGNSSYTGSGSGTYVPSGRDTYVPSGYTTNTRGGAIGHSGQGAEAVAWAESQLGVSESRNPGTVRGYSNGAWQAWCADFVSKSFEKTGGSPFGHQSSVQGILNWGRQNDRFISAADAVRDPSSLQIGDIATWKQNGRSHVGLVTGVNDDGTFNTIEGNTSDQVARRQHSFYDRGLTGFVRATETEDRNAAPAAGAKETPAAASGAKESPAAASGGKDKPAPASGGKDKPAGGSGGSGKGKGS